MIKYLQSAQLVILGLMFGLSCTKSKPENDNNILDTAVLSASNRIVIVNEGQFMQNNSSLSVYDPLSHKVVNNAFSAVNNVPLGDVANSASIFDRSIYIVINNSGKIYVADSKTLVHQTTITGLDSPREILFVSPTKAYVSDLSARGLHIIDLQTNTVSGFISTDNGNKQFQQHCVETMLLSGKWVYACSWSYGDAVLVIDPLSDKLVDSIILPKQPNSIVADRDGKLWVLSDGGYEGSPFGYDAPALTRIDPVTRQVESVFRMAHGTGASQLGINRSGDTLFFLNNGVVKMSVYDREIPQRQLITNTKRWYSLAVSPDADELYCADAIDYAQYGVVYRYSTGGAVIDSFYAGVNPGFYCFGK